MVRILRPLPDSGSPGALYQVGEIGLAVRCEPKGLADEFAALYRGAPSINDTQHPIISMQVRRCASGTFRAARYSVLADDQPVGPTRNRSELLPALEWAINSQVISRRNDFLQIHAASMVDRQGRAVLFVGRSGCGKSTLTASLLHRGWKYLCDEFAIIHPQTRFAHPFPKALCIKASGFAQVVRQGLAFAGRSYHVKGIKGRVAYLNPYDICPDPIGPPSPVRFLVFPQFTRGIKPRMEPISPGRAMFGVVAGVLNGRAFGEQAWNIIHDLVHDAEGFALATGDLAATCELLEATIDPTSPALPRARPAATGASRR